MTHHFRKPISGCAERATSLRNSQALPFSETIVFVKTAEWKSFMFRLCLCNGKHPISHWIPGG